MNRRETETRHARSNTQTLTTLEPALPCAELSFTRAEKSHFNAAKQLDDVASRSAVNSYYDSLEKTEQEEHYEAMHREKLANSKQQSLSSYFSHLGQKYRAQYMEHKEERKERHPGQLAINKRNVRAVVTHEVRDLKAAVKPYVREGEQAAVEVAKEGAKLAAQDKVKIGFYMESMCPGCKYFTVKVMQDLMKKPEFRSMVDVQVYPYGNGQLSGDKITCQHGADECLGNQVIACMQKKYPITEASPGFFPAFACMEAKDGKPVDEGQSCATDNNLDWAAIQSCANGADGSALALNAAQATESLSPAHEYAPWVTLNGKPMRDDAYNLAEKVCESYTGSKPGMCSTASVRATRSQALVLVKEHGFPVCAKKSGVV